MATHLTLKSSVTLLAAALACAVPSASATPIIKVQQGDHEWTLDPFVGTRTSAGNYAYWSSSAHPRVGPQLAAGVGAIFFYSGRNGLSFNMVFSREDRVKGGAGRVDWDIQVTADPEADRDPVVLVSDERNELVRKPEDMFQGRWRWNPYNTDGGAIGPLDDTDWEINILPIAYKGLKELRVYDGEVTNGEPSYITLSMGTGVEHSIRFTDPPPLPEPATLALLGLGLAGIGFARRSQVHRQAR